MLAPTLLGLLLIRPKADFDLNSRDRMDRIGLPQCLGTTLGHAEMLEMTLVLQLNESLEGVLKGNIGRNTGHLKEVHLLDPAQFLVDESNAAPEILGTGMG